ncbi:MAG: TetR/AcrR family transcriptional regulator, partial [Alphaproteobacteria bacterium]
RAQRMVLGVAERMPEVARRFFSGDSFSAHHLLHAWLDHRVAAGELVIPDTDLASRQFLELSMASIYKRRLFGNLPKPVPAAEIDRVVQSAVTLFMNTYGPEQAV